MEDKERFDLMLLRFKQIDNRINSLEQILNTLFFKILVAENLIGEVSKEKHIKAQKAAAKQMGKIKAQIDMKISDAEVPTYKKYMPPL